MYKLPVAFTTCCVLVLAELPAYVQKCSIQDPNINTCALNSAKAALPHLVKVNLTTRYKASYELQKLDDAEVYMIFKDYDCDIIPQDVMCRLGNLFNGNKLLGEAMNTFLTENWRLIYKDVGKTMSMAVGSVLFSILKESAKSVPYKDIFNDVE